MNQATSSAIKVTSVKQHARNLVGEKLTAQTVDTLMLEALGPVSGKKVLKALFQAEKEAEFFTETKGNQGYRGSEVPEDTVPNLGLEMGETREEVVMEKIVQLRITEASEVVQRSSDSDQNEDNMDSPRQMMGENEAEDEVDHGTVTMLAEEP